MSYIDIFWSIVQYWGSVGMYAMLDYILQAKSYIETGTNFLGPEKDVWLPASGLSFWVPHCTGLPSPCKGFSNVLPWFNVSVKEEIII